MNKLSLMLAVMGTALIAIALTTLVPEGYWLHLVALAFGSSAVTYSFHANESEDAK